MLIVGDQEKQDGTVTVRLRNGKNLSAMKIEEFIEMVQKECLEGRGIA